MDDKCTDVLAYVSPITYVRYVWIIFDVRIILCFPVGHKKPSVGSDDDM